MKHWGLVGCGAAALAGGMGIGRFAYTPILPMMHTQAGLTPRLGAGIASALVFVIAVSAVLPRLSNHHVGWTFG